MFVYLSIVIVIHQSSLAVGDGALENRPPHPLVYAVLVQSGDIQEFLFERSKLDI